MNTGTCSRVGVIDPVDVASYERHEGFAGLTRALAMSPEDIVREVTSVMRVEGGDE